jgi:DNA-binding transcriptional ArsR family regulator
MSQKSIFDIQADLCHCMSNALRIEIVHLLRDGPQRVSEIARLTRQSQATISRHLRVLRNGNIVIANRHAQDVFYQIANPKIMRICDLMREVLVEEAYRRSQLMEVFQDEHPE